MKKIRLFLFIFFFLFVYAGQTYALENPLLVANNKIGVHILFPDEIFDAAKLINANGGDWGYVTIPIQAGDRNIQKWQKFLDDAKFLHVIPILRLATEGDYFNTKVWRRPNEADIVDFANFLNSLNFPTKNRYIIVFNEVNRGDEWGGAASPSEYAALLSYAASAFKERDPNFFIISSGLDNAAPQNPPEYYNEYIFLSTMEIAMPGIFNQIDGFASHSYPNPGFSQPPSVNTTTSSKSFLFEQKHIESLSGRKLPVFVSETGWSQTTVGEQKASEYLSLAFQTVWNDNTIVAVTPFLLRALGGPFTAFSLLKDGSVQTLSYKAMDQLPKVKGLPVFSPQTPVVNTFSTNSPVMDFSYEKTIIPEAISIPPAIKIFYRWLLKL